MEFYLQFKRNSLSAANAYPAYSGLACHCSSIVLLPHFFRIRHWLWRWSARRRAGYFKARLAGDTQRCRSEENGFSDPFKNGFASSECSGFSKPRRVAAFFRWRAHRCADKITAKCSSIPRLLQSFQACFFDAPSCCAWRFNLGDEGRFPEAEISEFKAKALDGMHIARVVKLHVPFLKAERHLVQITCEPAHVGARG